MARRKNRLALIAAISVAAAIGVLATPSSALETTPPDIDLSSVDAGDAILSADAVELVASPDSVPTVTVETVIPTVSGAAPGQVGPSTPSCQFTVKVHVVKAKKSGTTTVTVQPALATAGCTLPNTYMDGQIVVYHNGTHFVSGGLDSCTFSTTNPCMNVASQTSGKCTSRSTGCNGSYWGVGSFDVSLVSGRFLVDGDAGCSYNSTTQIYHCSFTTNKVKV